MAILTAITGTNADMLPRILELYVKRGAIIADVTHGKGVFWKKTDTSLYDFRPTDLLTGTDFRNLPYADASIDALTLDPPYMGGSATIKKSLNDCYRNKNAGHEAVIRLYCGGVLEAARVLKKRGILIVKCQDETESGKQCFSHMELIALLRMLGFDVIDLFVLQQTSIPLVRKTTPQRSARKNHSYAICARFKR